VPAAPFIQLAPDWVCEVVWLVDPLERMVEVYRLDGDGFRLVVTRGGTDHVRLEPFAAIEVELEALWPNPEAYAK
jgi:Uma2 family endonuclease